MGNKQTPDMTERGGGTPETLAQIRRNDERLAKLAPETEEAQEVPARATYTAYGHKAEQAARLYRHAQKMETQRDEAVALLRQIAAINADDNSDEGWNAWGEAHCYKQIVELSRAFLATLGGGKK